MSKNSQSQPNLLTPHPLSLTLGLTEAMLYNIGNTTLKCGEAAGQFLSIEPLMRFIAEIHIPFQNKVADLIKASLRKPKFTNYWDCDPIFLTRAIEIMFEKSMSTDELNRISKFPAMRGKFLHGNYIELMEVMDVEPTSRKISQHMGHHKKERLRPGEIYESFLSMDSNRTFELLRQYSSDVRSTLQNIIRSLAK